MAGFINGRCDILSGLAASFSPVLRLGKGRRVVQRFLNNSALSIIAMTIKSRPYNWMGMELLSEFVLTKKSTINPVRFL